MFKKYVHSHYQALRVYSQLGSEEHHPGLDFSIAPQWLIIQISVSTLEGLSKSFNSYSGPKSAEVKM